MQIFSKSNEQWSHYWKSHLLYLMQYCNSLQLVSHWLSYTSWLDTLGTQLQLASWFWLGWRNNNKDMQCQNLCFEPWSRLCVIHSLGSPCVVLQKVLVTSLVQIGKLGHQKVRYVFQCHVSVSFGCTPDRVQVLSWLSFADSSIKKTTTSDSDEML